MKQSFEKALGYLAGNDDLRGVTVDELQNLEAENPYFPVTQLLLAKKFKLENDARYFSQVKKSALYFSNPYWLDYQLLVKELVDDLAGGGPPAALPQNSLATAEAPTDTNPGAHLPGHSANLVPELHLEEGGNLPGNDLEASNYPATNLKPPTGLAPVIEGAPVPEASQAEEEMAAIARDTNEEAEAFIEQLGATNDGAAASMPQNIAPIPTAELAAGEDMAVVNGFRARFKENTADEVVDEEATEPEPDSEGPIDDEHDRMFQSIKAMLDATSEDADADTTNAVVPIDPYYTIDYFASQGIKLELEKHPQDQLGQNLKKFTQWLRHMKKLGPEDAAEVISRTESEADIQKIADSSNTVREVVTEAMASVLEKQGKKDKAIELYNKLSFLNPDKSAYFVDKIKKLKGF